ncbi:hypothetical protein KKF84_13705 [Myxococcota bacterium]|nr:hypothetical protein [Myxococcota bacterium]MBU1536376.1 hypothetical protein [Myxococcota bacterium]
MQPLSALKKLAIGALSAGTTIMIAACYGPNLQRTIPISSRVVDPTGAGIRNLKVCFSAETLEECQPSRYGGNINIPRGTGNPLWEKAKEVGLTVCATDIDGADNGIFLKTCRFFGPKHLPRQITLRMDKPR